MRGQIRRINRQKGFMAVMVEPNSYSILELDNSVEIHTGDYLSGALRDLGWSTFILESTNERFEAIVQEYDCTEVRLKHIFNS